MKSSFLLLIHLLLFISNENVLPFTSKMEGDTADAFYLLLLCNIQYIVSSSTAGQAIKLNGLHMAQGPYFAHAWSKLRTSPSLDFDQL